MAETMERGDWEWSMQMLQAQLEDENPFGRATLGTGKRLLIARSPEQRARGMIGRRFEGHDGMLFVLPEDRRPEFHNRGVEVDLMLGLYDADGALVALHEMKAGAEPVKADEVCRYVLEVAAGDFEPGSWPPLTIELTEALTAETIKLPADSVNLRPAELQAPERCSNCEFYLGGGACEIVDNAGNDLVCDEFTPDEEAQKAYPDLNMTTP